MPLLWVATCGYHSGSQREIQVSIHGEPCCACAVHSWSGSWFCFPCAACFRLDVDLYLWLLLSLLTRATAVSLCTEGSQAPLSLDVWPSNALHRQEGNRHKNNDSLNEGRSFYRKSMLNAPKFGIARILI